MGKSEWQAVHVRGGSRHKLEVVGRLRCSLSLTSMAARATGQNKLKRSQVEEAKWKAARASEVQTG